MYSSTLSLAQVVSAALFVLAVALYCWRRQAAEGTASSEKGKLA
ncbi:MAG: hypothetical protein WAO22_00530 [bacterium]